MKRVFKVLLPLCIIFTILIGANNKAFAQPCDTCTSTWSSPSTTSFTFSMPSMPWCSYTYYIKYRTRICNGYTQIDVISHVIEDANPPGSSCDLHCIHTRELRKIMYNHLLNTLGTGATVVVAEPASCYYLGWIEVPPGAEVCYGFTPGSKVYITMPCEENGCCYKELTPVGTTTYTQTVINSTPCPPTPFQPPSVTIEWECDVVGVGSASFNVVFHPDSPIVCQMTCADGYPKPTGIQNMSEGKVISSLNVFPNPVGDKMNVRFYASKTTAISIDILDVAGRVVAHRSYTTAVGMQQLTMDTHTLPNGVYNLKVSGDDTEQVIKIVK